MMMRICIVECQTYDGRSVQYLLVQLNNHRPPPSRAMMRLFYLSKIKFVLRSNLYDAIDYSKRGGSIMAIW